MIGVRDRSFTAFGLILVALFFGAGAPTSLYVVYQDRYGFSEIMLTLIFAVYVLALLVTLVISGRVSDHAGRKPVLLIGMAVQLLAMIVFLVADGTALLLVARAVQGVATGLATSALSASLLDTEPADRPGRGSMISSAAPLAGLATGAIGAAVLVQVGPDPRHLVFWLLVAVYAGALALLAALPEPLPPTGDWRRSLRPRVAVPRHMTGTFLTVAPCMMATWALGGLYLSLGPSLTVELTGSSSHVVAGLVVVALMGTGALTGVLTHGRAPHRLMLGGAGFVIAGVIVAIAAIATRSTAALFIGSTIAGLGFGPGFAGAFRILTDLAEPHERAGLVAAIYVVSYIAFSVPAVVGGIAATSYGLRDTALVYACAVVALATVAALAHARQVRRVPVTA
jgi:MFS family permease